MNRRSDAQLVALICAELDRQTATSGPAVQAGLDQAREQALQQPALARDAREEALAEAARDTLDRDGALSAEVAARLECIRGAALTRMSATDASSRTGIQARLLRAGRRAAQGWRLPAGMVATGLVLVTAASLFRPGTAVESLSPEQELALLAAVEDIELYENLDFYLWLANSEFATQ